MVKTIAAAFAARIDALDWMAPATKAKAKAKLAGAQGRRRLSRQLARTTSGSRSRRGDALGNAERAELFHYQQELAKLGKPVDRDEWVMTPQTVNAVNLPALNALNFPAAILQPPFFDPDAPAAVNYGAIGGDHRPRDQPQLRRSGRAVRRRRQAPELVDAGGPRALPGLRHAARRAVRRLPALPRPARQRQADAGREHRRPRRARRGVRRLSARSEARPRPWSRASPATSSSSSARADLAQQVPRARAAAARS